MAGNVWEWVGDFYSETYYQESSGTDPIGPKSGKAHVMRGGSYASDPDSDGSPYFFYRFAIGPYFQIK